MSVIRVGSNKYKDCLKKRFALEREILKKDQYNIEINSIEQGNILFFECSVTNDTLLFTILKELIANVLSDLIINHLELDFLYKILNINCKQLSQEEEKKIINIALNRLNIGDGKNDEGIKAKIKRKNNILLEIIEYIADGQEIVLEGFVRFRLKGYLTELESAVKNAIEEYGVEKESRGFVHLLKHYVDIQANNSKLVNVIKIKNNGFKLLNENEKMIENPFLDEYVLEQLEQELDQQDLVISALISIAPQEIILHFNQPLELIENLKNIFNKRVSICLGCDYCKVNNLKELEEKISNHS
ncbi:putative sporulation protein YtxC [Halanaerobacter jeridensis]|uniref:Sporulation protein YtxC n=1 Tax=Halanaerobacter jeridensis TaxID=706427 RepID=A0A938XWD8_9FIRM|nr:putative sporulation protein YtxC [Halanaerobacter jeridensis]MBM7558049.1 putative sporulation protein YtxC [Halanaerobacter jeridensis]